MANVFSFPVLTVFFLSFLMPMRCHAGRLPDSAMVLCISCLGTAGKYPVQSVSVIFLLFLTKNSLIQEFSKSTQKSLRKSKVYLLFERFPYLSCFISDKKSIFYSPIANGISAINGTSPFSSVPAFLSNTCITN